MSSQPAEILQYLGISLAFVSLFASVLYILMFLLFSRNRASHKLVQKLILFVQLADAVFAVAIILSVFNVKSCENCCQIQAFLLNFGSLSSVLCRLSNKLLLYLALTNTKILFEEIKEIKVFCAVGLISFLISVMYS